MQNSNGVALFNSGCLMDNNVDEITYINILPHYIQLFNVSAYFYLILCYFFQFGNTCYSNSVLQALYFCRPFREKVLEYKAKNKRTKETLLTCLADLFYSIATQKKKVGSIAPKKFIARLRKEKGGSQYWKICNQVQCLPHISVTVTTAAS